MESAITNSLFGRTESTDSFKNNGRYSNACQRQNRLRLTACGPSEEYAIEQYESGKDKPESFETPEALIEDLHKPR